MTFSFTLKGTFNAAEQLALSDKLIKEITAKLEQAMVQAGSGKKQLKSSENEPEGKLTRWQYLKAFFTG